MKEGAQRNIPHAPTAFEQLNAKDFYGAKIATFIRTAKMASANKCYCLLIHLQ